MTNTDNLVTLVREHLDEEGIYDAIGVVFTTLKNDDTRPTWYVDECEAEVFFNHKPRLVVDFGGLVADELTERYEGQVGASDAVAVDLRAGTVTDDAGDGARALFTR